MKLHDLMPSCRPEVTELDVAGISCDSRRVKPGDLFVCINGPLSDGHDYAAQAVKAGAVIVFAEHEITGLEAEIVSDTKALFAELCAAWFDHPEKKIRLFGVTGTNGKTSVSYMLKRILEETGNKVGLIGTIQNMIGSDILETHNTTPGLFDLYCLLDQMVKAGCRDCVMEVSSHALDQDRVRGLHFRVGMFTNLTQDHLDYHKTMQAYCAAKKKLFSMCDMAVLNADDPYFDAMAEGLTCPVISYSARKDEADYCAKCLRSYPTGTEFEFVGYETIRRIRLKIGGSFTVYNAMCAITAATAAGIDLEISARALAAMEPVKGRCESVETGRDFSVIIDYAHTPDGLENILKTFRNCEKNRLIVVFGCGGDRDRTKRPRMGAVASQYADFVIVTSDNPRSEPPGEIIKEIVAGLADLPTPYRVIENRTEAIQFALSMAETKDIIVLAGKGHETYQILSTGTIHYDEREIVAEALKRK